MNLFTSSSNLIRNSVVQSLVVTLSLLTGYSLLGSFNLLKSSDGLNQWQSNIIKLQKYAYQHHSKFNVVLVGSSIAANIPADLIGKYVVNLGLNGGCTQRMFGKYKQAPVEKKLPRIVRLNKILSPDSHRGSHDSSLQYRINIGTV